VATQALALVTFIPLFPRASDGVDQIAGVGLL
jgi:hypothetical protein